MAKQKAKLCLNMIVKNESHIIEETLKAVTKYIDYYVISDTGSTDETKKIIRDYFERVGIKGEIYDEEWKDFGYNRSKALEYCRGKAEYVWVIDADDIIVGELVLPELKEDSYMLTYGNEFRYRRVQIFKNSLNWRYVGVLHEYPECEKVGYKKEHIVGEYYIDSRRLGDRNKDPKKYLKDAKILEKGLEDEPENERYMFYLAQSYTDYGDLEKGLKWYRKRVEKGGWYEEVYYSLCRIMNILIDLKKSDGEIEKVYEKAYKLCRHRAEAPYKLAKYYREKREFKKAYPYAKIASKIPHTKDVLFISWDVYDYKALDELGITSYYVGEYLESYNTCKGLLKNAKVPKNQLGRIKGNMEFSRRILLERKREICVIHTGGIRIDDKSAVWEIVEALRMKYNITIAGDVIDITEVKEYQKKVRYITTSTLRIMKEKIKLLILYENIDYFNKKQENEAMGRIVLYKTKETFEYTIENGVRIECYNSRTIERILRSIEGIVCEASVKNRMKRKWGIPEEIFISSVTEERKQTEKMELNKERLLRLEWANKSYKYIYPKYIEEQLKERKLDELTSVTILGIINKAISKLMMRPEAIVELVKYYCKVGDKKLSERYIEKVEKIIKNDEESRVLSEVVQLQKAEIVDRQTAYKIYGEILDRDRISEEGRYEVEELKDKQIPFIQDKYLAYPKEKIRKIRASVKKEIIFSVTTCKRLDLFMKTINSFINCCQDIERIDYWLCVDDNSSQEDRKKMKKIYPFIDYIWKGARNKGHCKSMNRILERAMDYKYLVHMEDDFHFIEERKYISESIEILEENKKLGQVLFNRNYAEIELSKIKIRGGKLNRTEKNLRYVIHEYAPSGTPEYKRLVNRQRGYSTAIYWPHFSFRPSVHRCEVLCDVGYFSDTNHFEMAYAHEYTKRGYKSAFLDRLSCIHIGKKTWEKNKENSYDLNEEVQFGEKGEVSVKVLSESLDDWKECKERFRNRIPYYDRVKVRKIDVQAHVDIWRKSENKYTIITNENIVLERDFNYKQIMRQVKRTKEKEIMILTEDTYILTREGRDKLCSYVRTQKKTNEDTVMEIIRKSGLKTAEIMDGKVAIGRGTYEQVIEEKKKRIMRNKNEKIEDWKRRESNLTFTMTTCKRYELFKQTMDNILYFCDDIYIIDEWIGVDDNSTEEDRKKMKERYPFINWRLKNEEEKGHAKSMNIILGSVKTDYVMHFEDDWMCNERYKISKVLEYVKEGKTDQMVLHNRMKIATREEEVINNKVVKSYIYNPRHISKPELNKEYDKEKGQVRQEIVTGGWWWPGFSLNPSIFNVKKVKEIGGKFDETVRSELFEYIYATKCYEGGMKISFWENTINHKGEVSSYTLNGFRRYYE